MLIYKQRYKPRTTREFTKSDLTVYDSAGNTALNALTVYGKSEVLNNEIVSAGEGWATVDLGTLAWSYSDTRIAFNTPLSDIANGETGKIKIICSKYQTTATVASASDVSNIPNMSICQQKDNKQIFIKNTAYTDPTAFQTAMSGVLLCYQLADPTQGNAIAVKTDNGYGIDGTMAVFETGTPLYGVSKSIRDVMEWDGSAGTVTKNCSEVDLGTLNYTYNSTYDVFITSDIQYATIDAMLCSDYEYVSGIQLWSQLQNKQFAAPYGVQIAFKNTSYTDAHTFKTAMSGVKLIYELATPTTTPLTSSENASIAGLRTFTPQTHAQNNAQTEMSIDYTIRVQTI